MRHFYSIIHKLCLLLFLEIILIPASKTFSQAADNHELFNFDQSLMDQDYISFCDEVSDQRNYLIVSSAGLYEKGHGGIILTAFSTNDKKLESVGFGLYSENSLQGLDASLNLPPGKDGNEVLANYRNKHIQYLGRIPEELIIKILNCRTHKFVIRINNAEALRCRHFIDSLSQSELLVFKRDSINDINNILDKEREFSLFMWNSFSRIIHILGIDDNYVPLTSKNLRRYFGEDSIDYILFGVFKVWLMNAFPGTTIVSYDSIPTFNIPFHEELQKEFVEEIKLSDRDSLAEIFFNDKTYHLYVPFNYQKYIGEIEDSLPNGVGILYGGYNLNRILIGEFINGVPNGYCTIMDSDSNKITEGTFINGRLNGSGIRYNSKGNPIEEAIYKNGAKVGDYKSYSYFMDQEHLKSIVIVNGKTNIGRDSIFFPRFALSEHGDTAWFINNTGYLRLQDGTIITGEYEESYNWLWFNGTCSIIEKDGTRVQGTFLPRFGWIDGPGKISLPNGKTYNGTWKMKEFTWIEYRKVKKRFDILAELEYAWTKPFTWFEDRFLEPVYNFINSTVEDFEETTGAKVADGVYVGYTLNSDGSYSSEPVPESYFDIYEYNLPEDNFAMLEILSEHLFQPPTTSGQIRTNDGYGGGFYSDSRDGGKRGHSGTDFIAHQGEKIISPITGVITNTNGMPYGKASPLRYTEILGYSKSGYEVKVKVFYIRSSPFSIGQKINAGDLIGESVSLQDRYPKKATGKMTDHVHVECYFFRNGWILFNPYKVKD